MCYVFCFIFVIFLICVIFIIFFRCIIFFVLNMILFFYQLGTGAHWLIVPLTYIIFLIFLAAFLISKFAFKKKVWCPKNIINIIQIKIKYKS